MENKQKQLNPNIPEDAIQIIDILSKNLEGTREALNAFNLSIACLNKYVLENKVEEIEE